MANSIRLSVVLVAFAALVLCVAGQPKGDLVETKHAKDSAGGSDALDRGRGLAGGFWDAAGEMLLQRRSLLQHRRRLQEELRDEDSEGNGLRKLTQGRGGGFGRKLAQGRRGHGGGRKLTGTPGGRRLAQRGSGGGGGFGRRLTQPPPPQGRKLAQQAGGGGGGRKLTAPPSGRKLA